MPAVIGYQPYMFFFSALFKRFKALFKWFAKGRYVLEALELQEKVGGAKGF